MDADEPRQQAAPTITVGEDLSDVSVADLRERIAALSQEITRVTTELEKKQAHEAAAASVFKSEQCVALHGAMRITLFAPS